MKKAAAEPVYCRLWDNHLSVLRASDNSRQLQVLLGQEIVAIVGRKVRDCTRLAAEGLSVTNLLQIF